MDNRSQAALEYLLLIGAAILIAAVVVVVLDNLSKNLTNKIDNRVNEIDEW
ncbi:MAG: class III signal peptide-containing protein [archaeon]|nr:class III signal peptide-containing protein [Candidatus Micrarchaeota archaeon]